MTDHWWVTCVHCHDYFSDLAEAKAHETDCNSDGFSYCYRIERL